MIKIVQSTDEALRLATGLAEEENLEGFLVGITGSFATGDNKKSSPIDIALKLKEGGDESLIGSISIVRTIRMYMEERYHNKYNVMWLDLLEEDEAELLKFMPKEGLEKNPESVYTNVVSEVKWVNEEDVEEDEIDG